MPFLLTNFMQCDSSRGPVAPVPERAQWNCDPSPSLQGRADIPCFPERGVYQVCMGFLFTYFQDIVKDQKPTSVLLQQCKFIASEGLFCNSSRRICPLCIIILTCRLLGLQLFLHRKIKQWQTI